VLADYGYDNYATTVYGMRPWIEARADAVKRFLAASAEGYRQCDAGEASEGMKLPTQASIPRRSTTRKPTR